MRRERLSLFEYLKKKKKKRKRTYWAERISYLVKIWQRYKKERREEEINGPSKPISEPGRHKERDMAFSKTQKEKSKWQRQWTDQEEEIDQPWKQIGTEKMNKERSFWKKYI